MGERDAEIVLATVREMTEERRARDIVPDHVLILPLQERLRGQGVPRKRMMESLEELRAAGKIKIGRTINDWYIRVIDEQGPQ